MVYQCKGCTYNMSGLTTGECVVCPECGAEYDPSVVRPFPSVQDYLVVLSVDWMRGLLVMIPLSLGFAFLVRWTQGILMLPVVLLLAVGLLVIAILSRNRVVRISDHSFVVPGFAWSLYSIPTLIWVCVYWVAVFLPWVFVL